MGTAKRERQKQGRQARIEAAREQQKKSQRLKTLRNVGIAAVLIVGAIFFFSRGGGDSKDVSTDTASSSTPAGPVQIKPPVAGAAISGDTTCPDASGASARTTTFAKAPPMCIDPAKHYRAEVETDKGTFAISLDPVAAPQTVNNFVVLARYHYFDGVTFHRIIPDFVVQGGDATGPIPGNGGPGYQFPDELPTSTPAYEIGSVAMANSGANTNGSQFFIVTGDQGAALPPQYSKFGTVTSGLDVVQQIGQLKTVNPAGDLPTSTDPVTITKITIIES